MTVHCAAGSGPGAADADVVGIGEAMVCLETPPGEMLRTTAALDVRVAGAELTALAAAAAFGLRATLVSRVGADSLGDRVLDAIRALHVRACCERDEAAPTGLFLKQLHPAQRQVHYYRAGSAAAGLSLPDLGRVRALRPRSLLVSGITLALGPGPRELQLAAARAVRAAGGLILVDPNLRPGLGDQEGVHADLRALLGGTDILVTGRDEAEAFLGAGDLPSIRHQAHEAGVRELIVKDGPAGLWLSTQGDAAGPRGGMTHVPAAAATVIDPVGAGDAVAGTYLAARLLGLPPTTGAGLASEVAARVVAGPGDTTGLPSLAQARKLLASRAGR